MQKSERTAFDPDFEPSNPQNRKAATERSLRFDEEHQAYVDEDGCLVRDRFGQPF